MKTKEKVRKKDKKILKYEKGNEWTNTKKKIFLK